MQRKRLNNTPFLANFNYDNLLLLVPVPLVCVSYFGVRVPREASEMGQGMDSGAM